MNLAVIKAVQELKSELLAGVISERLYQNELDNLIDAVTDEKTIEFIKSQKDRDI